jgi:hypothetical protein
MLLLEYTPDLYTFNVVGKCYTLSGSPCKGDRFIEMP